MEFRFTSHWVVLWISRAPLNAAEATVLRGSKASTSLLSSLITLTASSWDSALALHPCFNSSSHRQSSEVLRYRFWTFPWASALLLCPGCDSVALLLYRWWFWCFLPVEPNAQPLACPWTVSNYQARRSHSMAPTLFFPNALFPLWSFDASRGWAWKYWRCAADLVTQEFFRVSNPNIEEPRN